MNSSSFFNLIFSIVVIRYMHIIISGSEWKTLYEENRNVWRKVAVFPDDVSSIMLEISHR